MQYVFSMTSRMLAIAGLCAFLLCVLLFLLGIELGKRMAEPLRPAAAVSMPLPAAPAAPVEPSAAVNNQAPAVQAPAKP